MFYKYTTCRQELLAKKKVPEGLLSESWTKKCPGYNIVRINHLHYKYLQCDSSMELFADSINKGNITTKRKGC